MQSGPVRYVSYIIEFIFKIIVFTLGHTRSANSQVILVLALLLFFLFRFTIFGHPIFPSDISLFYRIKIILVLVLVPGLLFFRLYSMLCHIVVRIN